MSDTSSPAFRIVRLDAAALMARLDGMAELLHACVQGGASINFVLPFTIEEARDFWMGKVLPGVEADEVALLIAEENGRLAGTVYLDMRLPPNQPHRADVKKLMVHPDFRRRGIARALMAAVERAALERGRTLLNLDTRSGDTAEKLYLDIGYVAFGCVPGYAISVTGDEFDGCTFFYKELASS